MASIITKLHLFLICAIVLVSCATSNKKHSISYTNVVRDSVVYIEKVRIDTFKIKSDTSKIKLPNNFFLDTIFTYVEKTTDRSKIVVERIKDTVYITGYCDSIFQTFINIDKSLFKQQLNSEKADEFFSNKKSNTTAKRIATICIVLLILAIAFKILTH